MVKCGCADVRTGKMRIQTVDSKCGCVGKMWIADENSAWVVDHYRRSWSVSTKYESFLIWNLFFCSNLVIIYLRFIFCSFCYFYLYCTMLRRTWHCYSKVCVRPPVHWTDCMCAGHSQDNDLQQGHRPWLPLLATTTGQLDSLVANIILKIHCYIDEREQNLYKHKQALG